MQNSRDELDRILDEGIAAYPAAEPLAGIEERILERIRLTPRSNPNVPAWRSALAYGLVALVVACVVVVLMRTAAPKSSAIARKIGVSTAESLTPEQHKHRMSRARRPSRRMLRQSIATGPKQNSFPSPSPMTREEHLLQLLARTNPKEAAQASESMRQEIQPIEVLPIAIRPLPSGGDGQ